METKIKKNQTAEIPTKSGSKYSYQYVDIAQIHDYLEANQMKYYQEIETNETNGQDYIMTYRFIDGKWEDKPKRGCRIVDATLVGNSNPAQEQGSALTYARRYSLLMSFGLATEDDDAQSLSKPKEPTIKTLEQAREYKITFGKHSGKTLGELYDEEEDKYIDWLFDKTTDENMKKAITLLTGLEDHTPEETKEIVNAMPITEVQVQKLKEKYGNNFDELNLQIANFGKLKLSQLTYEEAEKLIGE